MRTFTGNASETTLRRLAMITVAAGAIALAGPAAPVSAGIPAGTFTEIEGTVPVTGLNGTWRLELFASDGGPGQGAHSLHLRKRNAAKTAWADRSWLALGGEVTCTAKLKSCTIDDQDELGTSGTMELTFTPTGRLRTEDVRCTGSDVAYGIRRERKGVLTGTLRLRTGSSLTGTIRNGVGDPRVAASIPVTASRTTYDPAVVCPSVPEMCLAQAHLTMDGFMVGAYRRLPDGSGTVAFSRSVGSGQSGVLRRHAVIIHGPGSSMLTLATKSTLAGASVDLSRGAPFLSGTVTYAGGGLESTTIFGCPAKRTGGVVEYELVERMPGRDAVELEGTKLGDLFRILTS